ncbi:MAG TPA: Ig-like domain-containing protein [Candidatus Latescibacteria bacterium]|nr:Ig-like domain-containing protein [Candidatus Latescibacterota bacterium]HJN30966.1 Ig-like domain-containing protein [Candidatus Latescibacterota bacterium]
MTAVAVVAGSSTSVHAQNLQDSGVELPGVWAGDATWGDYDRDGDQDLVLIGEIRSDDGTCRRIARVMRNDDGLLVEDVAQSDRLVGVYFGEARWADTDGDGDLDLAIAGWDENGDESLRVYTNDQGASESDRLLTLDLNQINDDGSASLTGVRYADMAWGDPDRDGDLDLVVTGMSAGGTSLTRLYANDRGRLTQDEFNSEALLNVHNGDIAWADIDNDGDLDLSLSGENVIADGGLAAITEFYTNDPTGTLTLEQGIDLGSDGVTGMSNQVKRGALSWSDFDGDGNLDLALSGRDAALNAVLKIFRNRPAGTLTEDGSFFLNRFQRVDGGAHWIDYDNDGDADLAVVGRTVLSNHQAFVFENRDGELSGVSVEEDIEGLSGGPTVWGDYDGDGRADLLITGVDADGQRQSILYSSRVSAANRAPEAPASLNEVTATSQRVLFSWSAGSDVESANLSYNVRIGTEPAEQDILSAEVPLGPGNAGLKSDYVLGSFLPPDTYFWSVQTVDGGLARSEFTAEGRFTVEQFVSSDQRLRSLSHSSMAWSDFDGDGDDDLALMGTNRSGEARTLLYANEEGTLSLHTDAGLLGLTKGDVAWADIDGDGDLDLFSGGQIADDNREDILYRVSGEGLGSTFDPAISFSPALDFSSAQFGDVDLDGDLDLVYAGQSDSVENNQRVSLTTVWLNDGDGGYSQGFDGVEGVNNGDLELADLDGDGDLDLLLTGAATDGDPRTLLYRNDHPLDFIDTGAQIQALKSSNLALGDVDRDGDLDLALGGLSASGLYAAMFTNDGGVLTQREDVALPGIIAGDFTWADYDNDQDLDLIVSGNNGATSLLQVFENTIGQAAPDSAFELLTLSNLSGVDFSAVSAADPDGDGDLDLISSGRAADFSPSSVVNDNLASQQFNSNVAPNAASTLVASDSADDVRLSWQPGSDDGAPPVASLSYNVRIGSESEGHDILSGARPLGRGNAGHNLFVDIEGLDSDTYFWSVQTIDAGGVASPWSTQSSFIVDTQSPSLTSLALNRSELGLGQTLTLNIGFADAHAGIDAAISPTVTATVADQGFEVLPLQFTGDTWTGELTITDGIPSGAATISVAGLTDLKGNVLVPVDSTGAFLVDADRPAVVASDPADGADSVTAESGASVTVTFSEPLDPATVLASNFAIRLGALSIASTATYVEEPDAITVALVPEGGLLPGNEYSVEAAAGIADLVGNVIGQSTTWSFRTQIPNLTETIPPASADSVDAAASVLSATFDTQVLNDGLLRSDAVRILREGVEVALRQTPVFDVPSLSLLFEPEGGLRPGSSYQVTLTGLLGGPLRLTGEGDYSWAFTTRLASPTEFSPARGDTGVPVTTSGIRVTFDAGIDPVVLASDDSAVQLFREGQLVDIGSPSYDPDARALSFGPTVGFLSGSTYRVVLDSELRGPQAAGEIDWSFRTQIPEVVSTTPTDAASITSDPRRISVTFSSPVDSAGRAPRNFRLARGGRPLVLAANEFLYDPATFTVSLPSVDLVSGSEYTVAVSGRIGGPQSALTDHLFTFRTEIPTVSSTEPADGDEGIGTSQGLISVDFSSPIANQSAEGFSLRSRSLDAADTTFVVLPITGFGADSTQTHINFAPEGGFRAFTEYEVIVDRRALGPLAEEGFSWRFSTAPRLTSISDGGTVSNADGSIELYLPPNALSGSDGEIAISPVTADDGAGRPVASQQTQVGPAYRIDAGSATLRKPATLTIGYDTDDLAGANAARLGIFALADGDVWTRVGGTVDEAARTVTTTVPALGTFGVFEDTGAGLGSLAVADVDCQPRAFTPAGGQLRDRTDISFDLSAPADVTVRVYNVSGRVERVLSRDRAMAPGRNTIVWDGRDDDADVVASGLYVVVVSVAGAQAEKVVAVVR